MVLAADTQEDDRMMLGHVQCTCPGGIVLAG